MACALHQRARKTGAAAVDHLLNVLEPIWLQKIIDTHWTWVSRSLSFEE
jgi:hypothetical protein